MGLFDTYPMTQSGIPNWDLSSSPNWQAALRKAGANMYSGGDLGKVSMGIPDDAWEAYRKQQMAAGRGNPGENYSDPAGLMNTIYQKQSGAYGPNLAIDATNAYLAHNKQRGENWTRGIAGGLGALGGLSIGELLGSGGVGGLDPAMLAILGALIPQLFIKNQSASM